MTDDKENLPRLWRLIQLKPQGRPPKIQKELVSTVDRKLTDDQLIKNNIAKKLRFDSDSDDNDTIKNFQG
ncbi:hypothetical protein HCN44_005972 [Aphidius gifuensis]|uniref:Uncharacterized protein n=1 Tax=Aphidius gifuensis TaxID=684658 RepID=A0A834Y3L2_APHGI|nr:hypothetical protein HCN44_005972 [Aphidius gifuensis]